MTLTKCNICLGEQDTMREHCRYCGARRVFVSTHSFEPLCVVVKARNEESKRELVRAYRSDFALDAITAR